MSIRSFKTSSIKTGEKRSKFWDQSAVIVNGAYEAIASAAGTGSSGTITFSSIPATYQHLQIRCILRNDEAANAYRDLRIRLNGDTGTNYNAHLLYGDGTSAIATHRADANTYTYITAGLDSYPRDLVTANVMGVAIIDIHDYASTTKNKTTKQFLGVDNNGAGRVFMSSGLWRSTSAVTSVSIISEAGNWTTQSQFALYGIKGA